MMTGQAGMGHLATAELGDGSLIPNHMNLHIRGDVGPQRKDEK